MDDARIKLLTELCEKATKGPWTYDKQSGCVHDRMDNWLAQTWSKLEEDFPNSRNNGAFIAKARTALPEALAKIAKLNRVVEAVRGKPKVTYTDKDPAALIRYLLDLDAALAALDSLGVGEKPDSQ